MPRLEQLVAETIEKLGRAIDQVGNLPTSSDVETLVAAIAVLVFVIIAKGR